MSEQAEEYYRKYTTQFNVVLSEDQKAQIKFAEDYYKERLRKIHNSLSKDDSGREDCTYGDTDYDSLSTVYGYNLAIQEFKEKLLKTIEQ